MRCQMKIYLVDKLVSDVSLNFGTQPILTYYFELTIHHTIKLSTQL